MNHTSHHHPHGHQSSPRQGLNLLLNPLYSRLIKQIVLKPGERLLDVGCGSGHLLELLHKKHPESPLVGLDVDAERLKTAQKKLPQFPFHSSSATHIPEPEASFDVVTSTLMFHHLDTEQKKQMLQEVYRVLKPGGRFYLFDFSKPNRWYGKWFAQLFREMPNREEALEGKYKAYLEAAGFTSIESAYRAYGTLELWIGRRPK